MVSTLSAPVAVCKVIALSPAAKKVTSFHIKGKSFSQIVLSFELATLPLTDRISVMTESQSWAL